LAAITQAQTPQDVRYILVDLKRQGDFAPFLKAPHLIAAPVEPIVGEVEDLLTVMRGLYGELKRRQKTISRYGYNIAQYNSHVEPSERLPRIVCVIDEYAAIRLDNKIAAEIDKLVILIGQQGRSSGIHLIVGVQQTTGKIMPAEVRYNMTTQIVGRQATAGAAQSATGDRQALKIAEVPGRMMCYHGHRSYMVQMPMIEEEEVVAIVTSAAETYARPDVELFGVRRAVPEAVPMPVEVVAPEPVKQWPPTMDSIIELAVMNNGRMHIRELWELSERTIGRDKIQSLVSKIGDMGQVNYQGQEFSVGRIGKVFILQRTVQSMAAD
jgi:DNA segregation ATPase FtsK/SpoIIIE-like protein